VDVRELVVAPAHCGVSAGHTQVGHPIVVWQIPIGNMAQNNTPYHYQDDKVDWLFSHMHRVARAHVAALLFGQGSDESTTAETDGGFSVKEDDSLQKVGWHAARMT